MSEEDLSQELLEKKYAYAKKLKERLQEIEAGLTQQDRDIRYECEQSLATFIKYAWKYMDPSEYIDGWHIHAVCDHLQAVVNGDIRNLIINQPPRTAKSLIVSVALTPWVWAQPEYGPLSGADRAFLYSSYAQTLSFRDSMKARRLITSPWYQKLWGNRFTLSDDMNTKGRFTNNRGGHRIATSVGGQLTGDGGNFLCFPYETKILTDKGEIEIGNIVENNLDVKILSFNHDSHCPEWDDIESYQKNPFRQLIEIELSDGTILTCTEDHEVYVINRGYIFARDINDGDEVIKLNNVTIRVKVKSIRKIDRKDKNTYNIGIKKNHNYFANGILVHNCIDDAHNSVEVESDLIRQGVLDWFDTSLSTRKNSPKTDSLIVVMQRLHSDDLTGHILDRMDDSYTHLMLPMRYDPARHCSTSIGFSDPRTEDGELLWPERLGEKEVKALEVALGPFGCTPKESPVLMSDLSMKPISEVEVGDEIVGFSTETDGGKKRKTLIKANVISKNSLIAPVFKITLDSGEIIRCTRDHKWYLGKNGGKSREYNGRKYREPIYAQAEIGNPLMRICNAAFPVLNEEQKRMAGWVAGFFDGEGTVSKCRRAGNHHKPSNIINFTQGADRNLPLCLHLEKCLSALGFKFNYSVVERSDRKDKSKYVPIRQYRIVDSCLPTVQKFVHLVKPIKWRQNMIDGTYGAQFIRNKEKVISIEPDGIEEVFSLETTTGNYVVWGIASSNSAGQLQQAPMPKGGGVIKESWWMPWITPSTNEFPPLEYVIAVADTAYTEKQENDYSACVVMGVYRDNYDLPKIMIMSAWQERLGLNALVLKLASTAKRFKVDRVLIENKASGISVAQEIRRLFANELFGILLVDPKGDKVARLMSVEPLFAEGIIHVPYIKDGDGNLFLRDWAEVLIKQVTQFPKSSHDDLVDCISAGIKHLRDNGLIVRREERDIDIERQMTFTGQKLPLYDV